MQLVCSRDGGLPQEFHFWCVGRLLLNKILTKYEISKLLFCVWSYIFR